MQKYEVVAIPMSDVNYLIGEKNITTTGLPIFDENVCAFLESLSKNILKEPQAKAYPDLVSFAFWIRKANIQKLKQNYAGEARRLGKGLCFHIAPSNIPVNFAFSYAFGLLAGNANIVRMPSKSFPQVEILLEIMQNVLVAHPGIYARTAFVQYARTSSATEELSKQADARMIWGGDATIHHLRSLPTKPRAVDITFADRYSIGLINAQELLKLDDAALTRLSEGFYNDTYSMDQNACSSPQLVFWLNDDVVAREKFWAAVYSVASQKYELQDAVAVDKFTRACADAIELENVASIANTSNLLYRVELGDIAPNTDSLRGKGGYFYEYSLDDMDKMLSIISDRYQTLTYFGVDPEDICEQIIQSTARGIDRIVPIGKAMDIDILWDGHDLVRELSRIITVSNESGFG